MIFIALQREAKLELFKEAVDNHASLTNQASEIKLSFTSQ